MGIARLQRPGGGALALTLGVLVGTGAGVAHERSQEASGVCQPGVRRGRLGGALRPDWRRIVDRLASGDRIDTGLGRLAENHGSGCGHGVAVIKGWKMARLQQPAGLRRRQFPARAAEKFPHTPPSGSEGAQRLHQPLVAKTAGGANSSISTTPQCTLQTKRLAS